VSKAKAVWDAVDLVVESGKKPVIKLSPVSQIIEPKRSRGRPRTKEPGEPVAARWALKTPSGKRMTCRSSGCHKVLRKGQVCCSDACTAQLREECELWLGVLDGRIPLTEIPPHLRSNRLRRKRTM
jgi:hypothetical protein